MSGPATQHTGILLSVAAIGAGLLLCWAGLSGVDVAIFHVLYISLIVLLALMCTSNNMRSGFVAISVSVVLVALWVFVNASYAQPVLYNSDLNTEWRIVQHVVLNSHLPDLKTGTQVSTYTAYPGLELVATSLDLVSRVAAYDFLTYGAALLSGIGMLLLLTFYRRLMPQQSLATKAFVVAAFSCSMIFYGALAIHQTLALVFICLALVGLSLWRKSPSTAVVLFGLSGLATVVSHVLTSLLFLVLIAVYAVSAWILEHRLEDDRQVNLSRSLHILRLSASLLLLYATIYLAWSLFISTAIVGVGYGIILRVLSFSWREYVAPSAIPTGTKPLWVTALNVLGFVSYGLATLAGLFASIRSRLSKLAALIPIGLSGGAVFLMLFFMPIGEAPSAGIQARGFLYAYLFGAPLFVVGLHFVSTRKPLTLGSRLFHTRILPLLILALVLSPAVYYGLPAYMYDRTSPLTALDTRLGLAAGYAAHVFASRYSSTPEVLAVDIQVIMGIGADPDPRTGTVIYPIHWFVPSPDYRSVRDLVQGHCRTIIMRQSITRVPDGNYTVTIANYQYLLTASNIVYSSGDPLILYTTYCATP